MKPHNPELISALLDGELKGLRLWLVKRHVDRCAACTAEFREIKRVREMLAANPVRPVMSDSPEFFWSKVKRDIQAAEGRTATVPVPRLSLADWLGQHRLAIAGATTALLAVLVLTMTINPGDGTPSTMKLTGPKALTSVANLVTTIPQTKATAFDTDDGEATVIWVSGLPWTKDVTDMETVYANLDS